MNARQKAKYYKKALENYNHLTSAPREIHLDRTQLNHYKMSFRVRPEDILKNPNAAIEMVRNNIFQQFVPVVCNNIRKSFDPYNNCYIFKCDIWTKH